MTKFPISHKLVISAVGTVLLALVGLRLLTPDSVTGRRLVRSSYDWSYEIPFWLRADFDISPVAIIYLDLESYNSLGLDPGDPFDRNWYARLLTNLTEIGTRAVVFDIVFSAARNETSDQRLAEAIRRNGHVVLAGEFTASSRDPRDAERIRSEQLEPPFDQFREAAAGWGVASLPIDPDFTVRQYSPSVSELQVPGLTWVTGELLKLPATFVDTPDRVPHWTYYYGPPYSIPHISFSEVLTPTENTKNFLRDKIVFVGARPMTNGFDQRQDEFRSPFGDWENRRDLFAAGVEVHATQMLNLIREDWLRRLSPIVESGIVIISSFLLALTGSRLRPLSATGLAIVTVVVMTAAGIFCFHQYRIWFPWTVIAFTQVPLALVGTVSIRSLEWYRERRRLEAIRRRAEKRIEEQASLLDKARDAILVTGLDGEFIYWNQCALDLYGWAADEMSRHSGKESLFGDAEDLVVAAREATLANGEWRGELKQRNHENKEIIVESRWTLIRDEDGTPKSILMINSDITERKKLEAQFLRSQRMETVGSLAGGMAHDLNNMLSPILMGIQLLNKHPQSDTTSRMLSVMESNTHRGAAMIKQMLAFSRGQNGEKRLLQTKQLIEEVERIICETFPKSIHVDSFIPDDLWPVVGDATQIHQVLLNLCVNARDAMPEGGELSIAADNLLLNEEVAAATPEIPPGKYVSLIVSDTGSGIPPELLDEIFEPFVTTKPEGKGTGLGLSTVSSIVRAHSGFITVDSEVGTGTSFEITLPVAGELPAQWAKGSVPEIQRGNGESILVVDDEAAIRDLLSAGLEDNGYRVTTASNGAEALAMIKEKERVDLVLMDTSMPVFSGWRAHEEIKNIVPDLPILMMSGGTDDDPAVSKGMLLQKPFPLELLFSRIAEALKQ